MIQPANNLMGKKWQDPVQEFEPSHHETQRNLVGRADSPDGSPVLTPEEVARRWKVSLDTVYRVFRKEPGVFRFKRLVRIPETVLLRVERRLAIQ